MQQVPIALGLMAQGMTLAQQLPYSFTFDELTGLLKEWPVVLICWPPQSLKSVVIGLLAITAMVMKKAVVGVMGINNTMALKGVYNKITSKAKAEDAMWPGVMHLLGLEHTVNTHLLSNGNSGLTNFTQDLNVSRPTLLLTPANITQINKIIAELEEKAIKKRDLVVIIDEIHSLFELAKDLTHKKQLSGALIDLLFEFDASSGR